MASYKAAEKLPADGGVRAIGAANHTPGLLRTLMDRTDVVPAVNQVERHPYFIQRELHIDVFDFALITDEVAAIYTLDTGLRSGPGPETIRLDSFSS